MIIQLNPLVPLETPRGKGMAHFLIDPGIEHHLQWVVFIDATGECWTFDNPRVKLQNNETARPSKSPRVENESTGVMSAEAAHRWARA